MSKFDRAECERLIAERCEMEWDAEAANRGEACTSDFVDGWNDAVNMHVDPLKEQLQSALAEIGRLRPTVDAAEAMIPDWFDTSGSMSRIDAMNDHCRAIADAVRKANEAEAEPERTVASRATAINITVSPNGHAPRRGSAGAAGYDLYAADDCVINPGSFVLVRTGVSIELPDATWEAQVRPRSGLTKTGLVAQLGTIDSDYRGEIGVVVANLGDMPDGARRTICRGDRIAQLVFARVEHPTLVQTGRLSETERGSGGFGSTGR